MTDDSEHRYPYLAGFTVNITAHEPPVPFGAREYSQNPVPECLQHEPQRKETQLAFVCRVHPSNPPQSQTPQVARLTIINDISLYWCRGPRMIHCRVYPNPTGAEYHEAFAKIYDPLYYPYNNDYGYEHHYIGRNVVASADKDYSREAFAYQHLQAHPPEKGPKGFIPAFFGSWTFQRPGTVSDTGEISQRPVRLILTEYFPEDTLYVRYYKEIDEDNSRKTAFLLPEDFRLAVLGDLLEGMVHLKNSGLDQNDFAPRNVILRLEGDVDQPLMERPRRCVLIDYSLATVRSKSDNAGWYAEQDACREQLPLNPMEYWWLDRSWNEFWEWEPEQWKENADGRRQWLYDRYGGDNRYQYAPLSERFKRKLQTFLRQRDGEGNEQQFMHQNDEEHKDNEEYEEDEGYEV